jgi:hypothetical protein
MAEDGPMKTITVPSEDIAVGDVICIQGHHFTVTIRLYDEFGNTGSNPRWCWICDATNKYGRDLHTVGYRRGVSFEIGIEYTVTKIIPEE